MITVAMIAMNEEAAAGKVIRSIKSAVPDAEILLIDSSIDNTAEIAEQCGARVIRQFPPKGYGPAMDLALRSGNGEVIVTLDCDGTYPVEQIAVLADYIIRGGYDIVDASRLKNKSKAMPWANYLANSAFAAFASFLFFRKITDLHSGMRAYRKSMLDSIKYDAIGEALPVELLLKSVKKGYKLKVIYIEYKKRIGKSTMDPIKSSWWTLKRILKARFSE